MVIFIMACLFIYFMLILGWLPDYLAKHQKLQVGQSNPNTTAGGNNIARTESRLPVQWLPGTLPACVPVPINDNKQPLYQAIQPSIMCQSQLGSNGLYTDNGNGTVTTYNYGSGIYQTGMYMDYEHNSISVPSEPSNSSKSTDDSSGTYFRAGPASKDFYPVDDCWGKVRNSWDD